MPFNSTTAILETFNIDPTEHYRTMSTGFAECHLNPVSVALHLITSPLGMIGMSSLLYSYTKSSSMAVSLSMLYLLSLLPAVPNGVFAGTAILCAVVVFLTRQWKLNYKVSILIIIVSYILQDLAHIATGEKTYQSNYSAGGHVSTRCERYPMHNFDHALKPRNTSLPPHRSTSTTLCSGCTAWRSTRTTCCPCACT